MPVSRNRKQHKKKSQLRKKLEIEKKAGAQKKMLRWVAEIEAMQKQQKLQSETPEILDPSDVKLEMTEDQVAVEITETEEDGKVSSEA